jgi:hypothetical protein
MSGEYILYLPHSFLKWEHTSTTHLHFLSREYTSTTRLPCFQLRTSLLPTSIFSQMSTHTTHIPLLSGEYTTTTLLHLLSGEYKSTHLPCSQVRTRTNLLYYTPSSGFQLSTSSLTTSTFPVSLQFEYIYGFAECN